MPSQYDALVAALKTTEIPFAEYGWKTRPAGMHGIVAIDFESSFLNGDGLKQDRVWEGSVDVFFTALDDRTAWSLRSRKNSPRSAGAPGN